MGAGARAAGVNSIFRLTSGAGATMAAIVWLDTGDVGALWPAVDLPVAVGAVLFFVTGLASIKAVQLGHLGLTWGVLRCSMLVPVLASILYWHEIPLWPVSLLLVLRLAGVVLACLAIALVAAGQFGTALAAPSTNPRPPQAWLVWLGIAFAAQGAWEVVLRSTQAWPDDAARVLFVAGTFSGAALLSAGALGWTRFCPGRVELTYGAAAGLLSMVASGARVWAVRDLDGVIVFPVTTISVMVLVQLLSCVVWHERAARLSQIGFAVAVLSVVLLTVPLGR